jgi:hypothetical protein
VTETPDRFRRRPAEIEAVQWTGDNADALRAFAGPDFDTIDPEDRIEDTDQNAQLLVEASHWVGMQPGDWVVKFEGYFVAKADATFRAVWEPAAGPAPATDRAALRDRIAEALADATGDRWPAQAFLTEADVVLAVLPASLDQADAANLRTMYDAVSAREHELIEERDELIRQRDQIAMDTIKAFAAEPTDRAAEVAQHVTRAIFALKSPAPSGSEHYRSGWDDGLEAAMDAARDAVLSVLPASLDRGAVLREAEDDEGDELVCVDECGSCDACGMEPFDTPAEGWREAARFLRRTACDSGDRQGALHGARLIETELRRMADEPPQPETQAAGPELDEPEPLADDTRDCVACGCFMRSHIRDGAHLRCAFCGCSDPVAVVAQPDGEPSS